jgi:hypothetical protein
MSSIASGTTTTTALVQTADTTGNLLLQTGSTPTTAVTINTSQQVGIGQTSPSYLLDVLGGSTSNALVHFNGGGGRKDGYLGTDGGGAYFADSSSDAGNAFYINTTGNYLSLATSGTEKVRIDTSGNLLINQTSATLGNSKSSYFVPGALVVSHSTSNSSGDNYVAFGYNGGTIGSISQSGTTGVLYNITSDRRLKTNIEPITNALDKVNTLDGVTYNWNELAENKDITIREAGLIAQQVAEVLPEVATTRDNGYMAIKYDRIIPLLVEAIKELSAEVKELKKKIS